MASPPRRFVNCIAAVLTPGAGVVVYANATKEWPIAEEGARMPSIHLVWDLEDDLEGNVEHVAQHGISKDEVEQVVHNSLSNTTASKSSQHRVTFGYTDEGRYLAVVWQHVMDDPLTIYPITAYDAPEPRRRRR